MLRLLAIPIAMLVLLVGALFWSGGGTEKKADLVFINRGEIGTLDPNRMAWMQDIRVGYCIYEGLYTLDPATLNATPGAASRHEVSSKYAWRVPFGPFNLTPTFVSDRKPPDNLPIDWVEQPTYTFHIRPDARWSDEAGTPVTAKDFVFAWRRMLEEPGDYTYLLANYIEGAEDYQNAFAAAVKENEKPWVPPDFSKVAIRAIDDRTLSVTLNHPVGFFLDIVAFPCCFPLLEKSLEPFIDKELHKSTGRVAYRKEFTRPPNLIGNGPYKLTSWEFKRRVRLEANPHHWNAANVQTKVIDVVSADDFHWAFAIYDTGGVDWLTDMSGDIAAELIAKGRKDIHVYPSFGTYFYTFNCQEKLADGRENPFADIRVRQAFSMAVNKKVIVDTVTRLGEPVTTKYIPGYAFEGYPSPPGLDYSPERAKALLKEAGYGPGGKPFPDVTLLFNSEGQHGPIAQIVRRQWLDVLGVDLRLEAIEIKTFRQRLHNKEYAVARASWYGDYNDPSTFTDKYKSNSDNNDSGWKNPRYDQLCWLADRERDPKKRLQYFAEAEKIMLEEAPILPMYHYMNVHLYRPEQIPNMTRHARNHAVLWPLRVQR